MMTKSGVPPIKALQSTAHPLRGFVSAELYRYPLFQQEIIKFRLNPSLHLVGEVVIFQFKESAFLLEYLGIKIIIILTIYAIMWENFQVLIMARLFLDSSARMRHFKWKSATLVDFRGDCGEKFPLSCQNENVLLKVW